MCSLLGSWMKRFWALLQKLTWRYISATAIDLSCKNWFKYILSRIWECLLHSCSCMVSVWHLFEGSFFLYNLVNLISWHYFPEFVNQQTNHMLKTDVCQRSMVSLIEWYRMQICMIAFNAIFTHREIYCLHLRIIKLILTYIK